jgi:hypothetical protein
MVLRSGEPKILDFGIARVDAGHLTTPGELFGTPLTRKLLLFDVRKGSVQQTLNLRPGRHEVRVRLRSGDDDKTARTSRVFRAGATRRLEVTAPRLRGGLTLDWK